MAKLRDIQETNLPYKSFTDITSDSPNMVLGSQNMMTTAQQLLQRIPGFSDKVESGTPTNFTAVSRSGWWALWGGSRFIHFVNDIAGGLSKVYKYEVGADTNYVLIFTSAVATPFDFVISNNTLYFGNNTEMRKYSGTGSTTTKWGIVRPAAPASVGTTGTGVSAYAGWYYRDTFCNSVTGHESSASDLSPCTGLTTNKTNTIPLPISTDTQVDQIRLYRTTDGGTTNATDMREVTGSPFPNIGWVFTSVANAAGGSTVYTGTTTGGAAFASCVGQSFTVAGFTTGANNGLFPCTAATATTITLTNAGGVAETHAATGVLTALEATADINLSTRTAPGTTSNDPPTPCSKLIAYAGRIFGAANATTYYSGAEELPANGVPEECWPSGLDGNNQPWPGEVTSQRPLANGVAVFTRLPKIFSILGTQRDNFIFGGLLDRRGAISHNATCALGNSVGWLDTASQVWLDGNEVGFDIRNDIKSIDHSQAYMALHLQGMQHWLCLLDGANAKIYIYDLDTNVWLPPKVLASGSTASALTSGESASATVSLTIAISKSNMYKMNPASFNDAGSPYSAITVLNLLNIGEPDGPFEGVAIETDSHTPNSVSFIADEDPTVAGASFTDMTSNSSDPIRRLQGVNLVKKLYKPDTAPMAERVAIKVVWPTADASITCYTLTINPPLRPGESK